jgi:hypothetical protein
MAKPCFIKKGSKESICGVHDVPLVSHESSEYLISSRLGDFTFLVCPVSGKVLDDEAPHQRGSRNTEK